MIAQIQPSMRISERAEHVQDIRERRRDEVVRPAAPALAVSAMYTVTTATSAGDAEDEGLHHRRVRVAGTRPKKIRRSASPTSDAAGERPPAAERQFVFEVAHATRPRGDASARPDFGARRKIGGQPDCPHQAEAFEA